MLTAAAGAVSLAFLRDTRAARASRPPVTVFFGDSLTAGLHASQPDLCYRGRISQRLKYTVDNGPCYAFIEDPYGLLDDAQTKVPLVLGARPALVFIELGHHETWSNDDEVARFEGRYRTILDTILRTGADVVPSTLAWLASEPGTFTYDAARYINDVIRDLAGQRGLTVADLWTATDLRQDLISTPNDPSFVDPYVGDGLHPNDAGHRVLADAFWQAYRDMRRDSRRADKLPL
jgi:lysophospholipase L1-like esterase